MRDAGHKLVSCFAVARSASQWFMAQYSARLLLQASFTFPTFVWSLSSSPVGPDVPDVLEAHAAHTASQKIWESLMGRIGFFSLPLTTQEPRQGQIVRARHGVRQRSDGAGFTGYIWSGAAIPSIARPSRRVAWTAATSASRARRVSGSSHKTRSAGSLLPAVYQREKSAASWSR